MRYVVVIIMGSMLFSACAALPHLNEALTLKDYADEKDAQVAHVIECNRKFEVLLKVVRSSGSLKEYRRKTDFIDRFGEPILVQSVSSADGHAGERMLYRYVTKYFDGPKVYVFFDEAGQLIRVECDGCQH